MRLPFAAVEYVADGKPAHRGDGVILANGEAADLLAVSLRFTRGGETLVAAVKGTDEAFMRTISGAEIGLRLRG